MGIASGVVLFLVIWFMTFLTVLPLRIQTPGDHHGCLGSVVGDHRRYHHLGRNHGARHRHV